LSVSKTGSIRSDRSTILLFAGLAGFHAVGLFSVGLLMGEGRLQCVLLGAATLLLLRAVLSAVLRARSAAAKRMMGTPGQFDSADTAAGVASGNHQVASGVPSPHLKSHSSMASHVPSGDLGAGEARWCGWRPVITAVAAAVVMLACNVMLQALGLIDRAGQDPHDKTQPSGELLVGADAAQQRALLLFIVLAPLVCMLLLFAWWGAWLGRAWLGTDAAAARDHHQQWGGKLLSALQSLVKLACSVQCVAIGGFWLAQLCGLNEFTASAAANLAWRQLQHIAVLQGPFTALSRACALLVTCLSAVLDVDAVNWVLHAAVSSSALDAFVALPLRLMLPRVVFGVAVAAFCGTAMVGCLSYSCNMLFKPATSKAKSTSTQQSAVGCQLNVWLCAVFAAALTMVLGYKGPATMLLALVQAGCCCVLLRLHAAATAAAGNASNCTGLQQQASSSIQSVVGGGMWGMMGLQLFFCSSHFCEFSGLQYASAFIGFDSMVWYTSGSLLLLNTCGFLMLAVLGLPAVMFTCAVVHPQQLLGQSAEHVQQQLACSMLVVNSMRFAALVVCMISAAVQQQHILLWAIFAPKLCFELWFMAVIDVGQLLASLLARFLL
jgi:hypothetical protein